MTTAVPSTAKPSSALTFSGMSQLYPRLYPHEPTGLLQPLSCHARPVGVAGDLRSAALKENS
jgi:hypothetical protein